MDFKTLPSPHEPAPQDAASAHAGADALAAHWQQLMTQLGAQISGPLSAALERVHLLISTGRIDRKGLSALRQDIESARHAGMAGQQIARLASGRVRQTHERVHLTHTLQSVLAHRKREIENHGVDIKQTVEALEVVVDPSMLFSLLNTLVDWTMSVARGTVSLTLDMKPWPSRARLTLKVLLRAPDEHARADAASAQPELDTMVWHLLAQTAQTMEVSCSRTLAPNHAEVVLEFPRTVTSLMNDSYPEAQELSGFASSVNSKPLAGSHVLVVTARRDIRVQVRESVRDMGLLVDYVPTVSDAIEFCREGLPHAILIESRLRATLFEQLMREIRAEVPEFVFIEITDDGTQFEISPVSPTGMARVGRDAIMRCLTSALVYELTRVM